MRIEHVASAAIAYRSKMAKSIRSKRKQKVKAARREKYREREKKKLWEKHLAIQAQRTVDMADVEGGDTKISQLWGYHIAIWASSLAFSMVWHNVIHPVLRMRKYNLH